MRPHSAIALAALLTCSSFSANAGYSLDKYREYTTSKSPQKELLMDTYITGVGTGIFWSNAVLEAQGKQPLFCMPAKLALSPELIKQLLSRQIETHDGGPPYTGDKDVEIIVLSSFIQTFPCP
jgi:hypothetical protein